MTAEQRPLLSICIPTFNRALLLKEAVKSILDQAGSISAAEVEVVISDNASTDETSAVVTQMKSKAKIAINYYRNEKNVGFDANVLLVVGRACGKYVWILGDDDLLAAGALKSILLELKAPILADVYLGEKEDIYREPGRTMRFRRIMRSDQAVVFDFRRKEVTDKYFRDNKKLIAYCNYISNIVFSHNKWLGIKNKEEYIGTGYVHLYAFQSMLWGGEPGVMKYLPWVLLVRRWGNDGVVETEKDLSITKAEARLKQDVLMYRRIAAAVFADRKYLRRIDDLVLINDGFSWAIRAKLNDRNRFFLKILPFLFQNYWDHLLFWSKIVPLVFLPNFLLRLGRGGYRKLIKGEPISLKEMLEA